MVNLREGFTRDECNLLPIVFVHPEGIRVIVACALDCRRSLVANGGEGE